MADVGARRWLILAAIVLATLAIGLDGTVLSVALNAAYRDRLPLDGLPPAAAGAARDGVFAAVRTADQVHSDSLREGARAAFTHGMDVMLLASAGIAAPTPRGRPEREPQGV